MQIQVLPFLTLSWRSINPSLALTAERCAAIKSKNDYCNPILGNIDLQGQTRQTSNSLLSCLQCTAFVLLSSPIFLPLSLIACGALWSLGGVCGAGEQVWLVSLLNIASIMVVLRSGPLCLPWTPSVFHMSSVRSLASAYNQFQHLAQQLRCACSIHVVPACWPVCFWKEELYGFGS